MLSWTSVIMFCQRGAMDWSGSLDFHRLGPQGPPVSNIKLKLGCGGMYERGGEGGEKGLEKNASYNCRVTVAKWRSRVLQWCAMGGVEVVVVCCMPQYAMLPPPRA